MVLSHGFEIRTSWGLSAILNDSSRTVYLLEFTCDSIHDSDEYLYRYMCGLDLKPVCDSGLIYMWTEFKARMWTGPVFVCRLNLGARIWTGSIYMWTGFKTRILTEPVFVCGLDSGPIYELGMYCM